MQSLIIVDDEPIILEGISKLIDYKALGATLTGTYENGVDAMAAITDDPPDVVIADIRMPGMSGIDLIRNCAQLGLDTQFIILSGYSEFEYARESMRYGVRHYLLKPCSREDIEEAVKQALSEARKAKEKRTLDKNVFQLQNTVLQGAMSSCLNEAIFRDQSAESLAQRYEAYIDLTHSSFRLFYIYFLPPEALASFLSLLKAEAQGHWPQVTLYCIYVRNTYLLMYQDSAMESSFVTKFLERVKGNFSRTTLSWEDVLISNGKEMIELLVSKIRRYGSFYYINGFQPFLQINYSGITKQLDEYYDKAIAGDEQAKQALLSSFANISDPKLYKQLAISFLLRIMSSSSDSLTLLEWLQTIEKETSLSVLQREVPKKIESLLEERQQGGSESENLIKRIRTFVNTNLEDPRLTLKYICEQYLYMNVDYVSRKFHHETGQKFSAYLTDVRIARAQKLIENNPNILVADVAQRIGFVNNPQYFSQLFRKKTGITPSQYAENIRTKGNAGQTSASN